ncbi:discoidin domain-containing protein [Thalassotalea marina]|uniref:F5/8 type C domain-containing protein n=1 Tax=Thalassotalea marina TaxID=1673741 RepID=A0A919EP34_9GAMM|nr:discoidin domain-containing protein [Thalassotalea marina]GHG01891.1 hypothetical protein GCM10017161_33370 [Thalassotalea marina]
MSKFTILSLSTSIALVLSACGGGSDDPKPESIPKRIESTSATLSGSAIKGTLAFADIEVNALNGAKLKRLGDTAQTNTEGNGEITVKSDAGFGITGIVEITATANANSLMTCDAVQCGDASMGDTVAGNVIAGTQLSTLTYVTVPYGHQATASDATFHINVLTSFATKMIQEAISEGRNVSTEQLLLLAQQEYSTLVLKALGIDANNVNVFSLPVVSAEKLENFIVSTECEDQPVLDDNGEPLLDDDGNEVMEEVCTDTYLPDTEVKLSLLNGAFSSFASGYTQQATLVNAYANMQAAIAGNPDALNALRSHLYQSLTQHPFIAELGLTADDVMDLTLPLIEEQAASGPVREVTTPENMAGAVITARNRIGDGEAETKAFDGDVDTKWLDHNDWAGAPTVEDPSWIQVQFEQAHAVNAVYITSANDADNRDPENFDILGSQDGETWVTLASFVGEAFDERFQRKAFKFANSLAYRYYRLNITKNKGNDTLMQLAEIQFVGPIYESVDHTKVDSNIAITARNRIGDGEAESKAFDGDVNTKWLDHNDWAGAPSSEDPSWVQVDFTEAVAVNELAITSANDAPNRDPENFDILASNDGGATWTLLGSWLGESFDERFERKVFGFANSLAFTTYRLNITKNKGDDTLMQVAEIELIGPKLPDLNHGLAVGTTITASNRIGDAEAETMAFDGNLETKWLDHNDWAGAPTEEAPSWVQVQFPEPVTVNKLGLISANDAENRDPENFNIQASNDGENWITLANWLGESFDQRFERKLLVFSNDLAYSYYRLNITKNKGDDTLMQVAEIELIGPQYNAVDHSETAGVVITARNRIGDGEAETKAFDNDTNTKWLDHNDWAGAPSEEDPSWIQVDFLTAQIVSSLAITSANDADNRDPENFNLQGSNDGGVTWVTIGNWVGESWDNRFERKLFDMGNGFAFESYRLNITKNKGDDTLMQIAEIELIGPQM